MTELTRKQKNYLLKDMLSTLNGTVSGKPNISVKNLSSYKQKSFALPIHEIELVVSIIEELKPKKVKK